MNCIKEAESKLRDYQAKRNAEVAIQEEIARFEQELTCVRSATKDSTPVSGGGNCREDALLNNIAKREELHVALANTRAWLRTAEGALNVLSDEERHVLDRFYIHPQKGNVARLMEELHVEKTQVYDRKNKAVRKFALALYGVTET